MTEDDRYKKEEEIGKAIVHAAFKVHKALGPGLLEKYMRHVWNMSLKKWDLM